MRVKIFLSFVLGLIVGFVGVVLLAYNGNLRLPVGPSHATAMVPVIPEPAPSPAPTGVTLSPVPTGEVPAMPPTGEVPPILATVPPPSSAPTGSADRIASGPQPPHIAMPLAGVDAQKLRDTYQDKRDGRTHEALDIEAPKGTPVLAVAEGNVVKLFHSKDGGTTVYQFDNSQNWCFYYAHLDRYAPGLTEGTLLHQGQVLGYVGSTGNASPKNPHLHFAVNQLKPDKKWWSGTPVDPLPLLK